MLLAGEPVSFPADAAAPARGDRLTADVLPGDLLWSGDGWQSWIYAPAHWA